MLSLDAQRGENDAAALVAASAERKELRGWRAQTQKRGACMPARRRPHLKVPLPAAAVPLPAREVRAAARRQAGDDAHLHQRPGNARRARGARGGARGGVGGLGGRDARSRAVPRPRRRGRALQRALRPPRASGEARE